ncbi:PaaI family thioesterase [Rhodococcus koreensis]|uniref:PaaI family thioesterase n=1 Tax=Rhodococcus koreensis TaxID=99653 RepID=UPI00366B1557
MLIAKNPEFEQIVKTAVLTMPAAMHLGFHFGHIAPGEVELVQPYRTELTEHNGLFQGGVIGALADFAGGAAAGTLLPVGWVNMTADYTVKLLAPAEGETITARGHVLKPGRAITVATADVYAGETHCATALITMRNVPLAKE